MSRWISLPVLAVALFAAACGDAPPPDPAPVRYPVTGQVMAVSPESLELTLKHEDIVGFMPGMTMAFPVADAAQLEGRVPGDLVSGTLEVSKGLARIVELRRTGSAPLPSNTNEVALAEGLLEVGDAVPDVALIDQSDRRRALAEWKGTTTLVSFAYTTCPIQSFCPLMDRHFATLQGLIAGDRTMAGKVRLISITLDPATDTPSVLAAHAEALKADPAVWTFLTGDLPTVNRVAGRFGVGIVRPDGPGEISHNLRTTLVGPDGRVRALYPGNTWTPQEVLSDIRASVATH
jgi:protein SCO1/2